MIRPQLLGPNSVPIRGAPLYMRSTLSSPLFTLAPDRLTSILILQLLTTLLKKKKREGVW